MAPYFNVVHLLGMQSSVRIGQKMQLTDWDNSNDMHNSIQITNNTTQDVFFQGQVQVPDVRILGELLLPFCAVVS